MSGTMHPKHFVFDEVYEHYLDKVDNGRFTKNPEDMRIFMDHVMNSILGCPVASSFTGIGADITNGFVQFVVDNPYKFTELNCMLVDIMDRFASGDRPTINIRSKTLPKEFISEQYKQFIVVAFRSPPFKDRKHAEHWWAKLAKIVQSYSS